MHIEIKGYLLQIYIENKIKTYNKYKNWTQYWDLFV